jgi:hypothetical protein
VHVSIVFSFLNSLKNSQCHQCSVCCDFYLDTKIILSYFLHGNISYLILVYNNAFYPIVIWIIINIKTGTLTDIEQQFHAFGLVKDMFWRIWPSQKQLRGIYSLLGIRVPAISLRQVLRVPVMVSCYFSLSLYLWTLYICAHHNLQLQSFLRWLLFATIALCNLPQSLSYSLVQEKF